MPAQRNSKYKKLKLKAGNEPTPAAEKAKTGTKSARTRIKEKKRATPKSRESLTKAEKASQDAPRKVKQGHQARIKRVSFIVRLTVDEYGQPGRTEIEHVPSGKKQNLSNLEAAHLVTFIKSCLHAERVSEDTIPRVDTPEALTVSLLEPAEPKPSLVVSDVQVFRRGNPDFITILLAREEPFAVQIHFQIHGQNVQLPALQESTFETKIFASEVSSGKSQLLKTHSARLNQHVFKYTVPIDMDGLPFGLYRLSAVVTLQRPINLMGFYGKTMIQVD